MTALIDLTELMPDDVETVDVSFGEWLPDVPAISNPGAVEALNVIPVEGVYTAFSQHSPDENAVLTEAALGAAAVVTADDVTQLYAGTISGIYTKLGAGFVSLYSQAVSDRFAWKFIRVNEQMVALHPDAFPQRTAVDTTDATVTVGGSPPRAMCGAQVGDFLMLGYLLEDPDDFNNEFPSRVRWSGYNNIDSPWVSDPATQADFQDMPAEGGPVRAISGRTYGTIFQERMISRATYRGLPQVFEIETVEDKRGAIARDSVVDMGPFQFFIAEDGFHIWNGTNTVPIAENKVNRYFFNRLEYSERHRICGAVDFKTSCIMWAFPTDSSGLLTEIIIYSWRENKWSHSIQTLEFLLNSAASNVTLEELTEPLEDYTISFDDASLRRGGRSRIAAFNEYHTYGLFDGLPMAATIDTGEASGPNGRRVYAVNARPLIDLVAPSATMQLAMRDQMVGQPVVFSDAVAQELDGTCPIIGDARYMRFRVNIPVDVQWCHAVGIQVARKATGVF